MIPLIYTLAFFTFIIGSITIGGIIRMGLENSYDGDIYLQDSQTRSAANPTFNGWHTSHPPEVYSFLLSQSARAAERYFRALRELGSVPWFRLAARRKIRRTMKLAAKDSADRADVAEAYRQAMSLPQACSGFRMGYARPLLPRPQAKATS
jgi:hypothetical protein